jgi:hypothetical protein
LASVVGAVADPVNHLVECTPLAKYDWWLEWVHFHHDTRVFGVAVDVIYRNVSRQKLVSRDNLIFIVLQNLGDFSGVAVDFQTILATLNVLLFNVERDLRRRISDASSGPAARGFILMRIAALFMKQAFDAIRFLCADEAAPGRRAEYIFAVPRRGAQFPY